MSNFQRIDELRINGNNFDRTRCTIQIAGPGMETSDITDYVKGIEYTETPDIQFGYSLGSRRPTEVGQGNIVSEGMLTVSDAGLQKLDDLAIGAGLPSLIYLGSLGGVNITIEYTTYAGDIKVDMLENVYFTSRPNGVNVDSVLYTRDLSLIIGRIASNIQ